MIYLFSGYKVSPKRYNAYLADIIIDPTDAKDVKQILTHSVGLVKALLFCQDKNLSPQLIVAMDPPDLRVEAIRAKLSILNPDLQTLYIRFLKENPPKPRLIYCYRSMANKAEDDANFDCVTRYVGSHYPFEHTHLRHNMLQCFLKRQQP
jgi:hypothetical protein